LRHHLSFAHAFLIDSAYVLCKGSADQIASGSSWFDSDIWLQKIIRVNILNTMFVKYSFLITPILDKARGIHLRGAL
jgi:hypothetical protein